MSNKTRVLLDKSLYMPAALAMLLKFFHNRCSQRNFNCKFERLSLLNKYLKKLEDITV